MSLETAQPIPAESSGPTEVQAKRTRSLRRFNWLFVYLPILLATGAVLALIGLLLWYSIIGGWAGNVEVQQGRALASGLADTIFILAALPWALLCPVLPLAFFAGLAASRRKGVSPVRSIQKLLHKLDDALMRVDQRLNQLVPRVTGVIITARAQVTRAETTARRLLRLPSTESKESKEKP
jgi:hypothetical protein